MGERNVHKEVRNSYKIQVRKLQGKKLLERFTGRWTSRKNEYCVGWKLCGYRDLLF
jgi:hypothetical protein